MTIKNMNDHIKSRLASAVEMCLDDYMTVLQLHDNHDDAICLSSNSAPTAAAKNIADRHKDAKIILSHLDSLMRLIIDDKGSAPPNATHEEDSHALILKARKALKAEKTPPAPDKINSINKRMIK